MRHHTPGPWHVVMGECPTVNCSANGLLVAACGPSIARGLAAQNSEANATLIAAAPEMLEALIVMLDMSDSIAGFCARLRENHGDSFLQDEDNEAWDEFDAARAKAFTAIANAEGMEAHDLWEQRWRDKGESS